MTDDPTLTVAAVIVGAELVMLVLFIAVPEIVDHLEAFFAPTVAVLARPVAAVFASAESVLNRLAAMLRRWTG